MTTSDSESESEESDEDVSYPSSPWPLHLAAYRGNVEIVNTLLDRYNETIRIIPIRSI